MKDSDFFADVARSAKRASGRSPAESRAIRDAIWPGGMPVDYKPQYPALLTTHLPDDQAFFERLSWPMVDAIWMLSTGEGPTDNPSEERLTFGRALKGESDDWSGRKPHKRASHRIERRVLDAYQYWLAAHSIFTARSAVNELFGVAQFEGELLVPQPIHFHEWIRWTQLFKLPVARRFWDAYYAWKASAWASGTQMAWLGTWRDASWWPVLYGPVPSELTWRIPYSEDLQVMMQTEAPARFIGTSASGRGAGGPHPSSKAEKPELESGFTHPYGGCTAARKGRSGRIRAGSGLRTGARKGRPVLLRRRAKAVDAVVDRRRPGVGGLFTAQHLCGATGSGAR
jgi:hypothetical protein